MTRTETESRPGVVYAVKLALICAVSLAITIHALGLKAELHNDEYTSYIIANNAGAGGMVFSPEDNVLYDDPARPFLDAMTVTPGHAFDYAKVWENDVQDTLPPLHYALLHTVSSFFPGRFSIWYGGVINLAFLAGCIALLSRLQTLLGISAPQRLLACLCFAVLPGVIEIAQFLRMYTMCMFWVLWLSCEQLRWLQKESYGLRQAVRVALPAVLGVLTHYYFLLFAVFQCLVAGAYLLSQKRWKEAGFYALTFAAAAGVTIAVYPGILRQLFGNFLMPDTVKNLTGSVDLLARFKGFYFVINSRLFGGHLTKLALACAAAALALFRPRLEKPISAALPKLLKRWIGWLCVVVPCALYFLLVTKIAFFTNTRYMCFVYPIIVLLGVDALMRLLSACAGGGGKPMIGLAALLCVLAALSANQLYPAEDREYTGANGAALIAEFERHAALNAVCVYTYPWQAENTYNLNKNASGLVFTKRDGVPLLSQSLPADTEELLVQIETSLDAEEVLCELTALFPGLTTWESLGDCSFFHTYLLR